MQIRELFDRPETLYKTEDSEDAVRWDGFVEGEQVVVLARELKDSAWVVEFRVGGRQDARGDMQGREIGIFSAVIGALQEFASDKQPSRIVFTASKEEFGRETGRARLYDRLVTRFAGRAGYDHHALDDGGKRVFVLQRRENLGSQ